MGYGEIIWDMGYRGVQNLGYGILGVKNLGYGILGGKKYGIWDMGTPVSPPPPPPPLLMGNLQAGGHFDRGTLSPILG